MIDSIRQRIFLNVETSLQLIKGAPDYNLDVDENSINIVHGTKGEYDTPNIYLYPGPEVINMEKSERGKIFKTLSIELEMWVKAGDKSDLNEVANQGLADMEKALMTDSSRGDLAIDTRFVDNTIFIQSIGSDKAGVILSVEIDYQQNFEDPTVC